VVQALPATSVVLVERAAQARPVELAARVLPDTQAARASQESPVKAP